MRVPLRWLAEWIALPDVAELAERLTAGGLEVDAIERTGPDLSALQVGLVRERLTHPNADRLSLCKVEIRSGELREIVCGAPNVDAGQKVAVALAGTRLPDGTPIKKSKIRGVTSEGMICSARELGIGEDQDGILVLDEAAEVGARLDRVLSAGDHVLEIAITPNRGDCTSMLGIAREVSAHFGGRIELPEVSPEESGPAASRDVRISIDDSEGCYHYVARLVRGVKVASSPSWLVERLEAAGLRSIHNVVDVTNLVMLEFGQPLHAFDLAALQGGEVRVRAATAGESLEMLDGQTRSLDVADLVIADAERPIALAGIMGGSNSEVGDDTRDVLIESAHFAPARIRHTARRLGLATEASYRFERGVDRAGVERAAHRAARLIAELTGGRVATGLVEARGVTCPQVDQIELEPARVNRLLGTDLAASEVCSLLKRQGIEILDQDTGHLRCRVPSHRADLALPEDLIEEVARIYGYDRIPTTLQEGPLIDATRPASWRPVELVQNSLRAEGWIEVASFPFIDPQDLDHLQLDADDPRRETLAVLNPLADRESHLRSSLLPSLLRLVRENLNRQLDHVALFELARVFRVSKRGELPEERLWLTAVVTRGEEHDLWAVPEHVPLFFEVKGAVERMMAALGLPAVLRAGSAQPYCHPGAACSIVIGRRILGETGELHPEVATRFGIDVPCAVIELDLSAVASLPAQAPGYHDVSKQPLVRRDLAVLVDQRQPAGEILEAIRKRGGANLIAATLFDRYEGVSEGKVSLAFRLTFQHAERTLTDAEVSKAVDRVVQMLGQRFGGELR